MTQNMQNETLTQPYFRRLMMATPLLSLVVWLLSTLYMTLPLVFGLIMRDFLDTLSAMSQGGAADPASVRRVILLVIAYLLARFGVQLLELGSANSSAYQYYIVEYLARRNLFRTILQATGFSVPFSSGEVVNRFDEDTEAIAEPVFMATYGSGFVVSTAVTFCVLVSINVPLAVLAYVPAVLSVLLLHLLGGRIERYHAAARDASEQVSGLLTQLLDGIQAIKVAVVEESVVRRFDHLSEERRLAATRDAVFNSVVRSMNETTALITIGLLLIFAAGYLRTGTLSIGDLALFISYIALGGGQIEGLVDWIQSTLRDLRQGDISMSRIEAIVPPEKRPELLNTHVATLRDSAERDTRVRSPLSTQEPLRNLTVTGLSMSPTGAARGISAIDLTIARGEFVVVTGRIGAGKSLLLETLLGLHPRDAGAIYWNDHQVNDPATFFTPPRVAYTPQTPRLFSESIGENIWLGWNRDTVNDPALEAAIHAAVLEKDILQLEDGLETIVGPRGVKLSGGQVQRTAAARMFVRQPELLVFDDLSSALDVETEETMWSRIFNQEQEQTCLVVSHRRAALQRADRVIVLKEGHVEDAGTLAELLNRSLEMQQLWQSLAT